MNSIKKDPVRVRPLQLKIWVSAEEKKRIEKRAEKFQSTAEYLRQIALKGKIVERPPSITLDHYLELNRIGNNINQIAKRINSSEANIFHKRTKKEIEQALTDLTELLRANTEALKELLK